MKELKKTRYKTRTEWLDKPAGTECYVHRGEHGPLVLTFDDGTELQCHGWYYAAGLEDPPLPVEYALAY